MSIFNQKRKLLHPLSHLIFFLTNEGPISGLLGALISTLLSPILDLSFGDLWLSKTLSRVMDLLKNLIWVSSFSTFKTYASCL
jgi:hypothetical protein